MPNFFKFSLSAFMALLLSLGLFRAWNTLHSKSSARSPSSSGADPGYFGLPTCLDFRYTRNPEFLPYSLTIEGDAFQLPLADDIDFYRDQARIEDETQKNRLLLRFFPSRHLIRLPAGATLSLSTMRGSDPSWVFPEGAELVHEIFLDPSGRGGLPSDREAGPLEVRVERMIEGAFRYGVYERLSAADSACPSGYRLRTRASTALRKIQAPDSAWGDIQISYVPLSPAACLDCHQMGEAASGNRPRPCAFDPPAADAKMSVHAGLAEWIRKYQSAFGHSPISEARRP